ncbi:hypothetical protein M9Y10_010169 [Tritrichomonas musculus]|uniref:Myb-like DNA-binding domain containing protein n=1 Tax=Tritrichomonas musculus TaxID=1915356 RepID=A0ABR2IRF1_9EUKA
MLAFPTFSVNNNNNSLFQYNIQPDANFSFPIIVSFPSLSPYGSCINVPYSFLMNLNSQNYITPQSSVENSQPAPISVPEQLKDNLIKKMINLIGANTPKTELGATIKSDINKKIGPSSSAPNVNLKSILQSPPESNKKNSRVHFTKEEDDKIKELVKKFGTKNWSIIALFMDGRTAKQCRDRYSNYLIPGFFQGEWSKEEDELLKKLYSENGSKWSIIQTYFPNRSSNSIKNRWYYFLRKKDEIGLKDINECNDDKEKMSKSKICDGDFEINEEEDNHDFNPQINTNNEQVKVEIQIKEETDNLFEMENEIIDALGNNTNMLFDDEWITFN